jgi:transcriptional regulator with XRE-family HTH domain
MRFGELLLRAIGDLGISQREFARRVKYPVQSLNQVIRGKRRPPPRHLDAWMRALGKTIDPVMFRQLAMLEHTPQEIRDLLTSLRKQLERR